MSIATIGSKIKQERENKKITLRKFASQLGISAGYLVDIEKNRRLPSKKILQKAADLLELPTSTFDEFSPEIPKPVKSWIKKHPLIERILRVVGKAPFPEKLIENLERTSGLSKDYKSTRTTIAIYESELQAVGLDSASWDTETGGDLFGIWGDIPVIYLATRSGPNSIRDHAHFRLDVDYLIKLSTELQNHWGLRYFGDWHSHHRLGLEKPSSGDQSRIERLAAKNNFRDMAELIITFSSAYAKNRNIDVHCYAYQDLPLHNISEAMLIVLKGTSPIREALIASSLLPEQQLSTFSSFSIDRIVIPNEPLGRVPGCEGSPIEQISEKILDRALLELAKVSSDKMELHKTSFGLVIVMPVNKTEHVAFAVDKKWPHKLLQVDWMDRSNGTSEEILLDIGAASLLNVQEFKNIFLTAKKQKQKVC
jgi:transcriptional regulator with XRE-family HTH domain